MESETTPTESPQQLNCIEGEDSFDVDLIEIDDLINSANQLLEEVFRNKPMPVPRNTTDDAIAQVNSFLRTLRQEEEEVIFVEERPGNAPRSSRPTAVVDLCTPDNNVISPNSRRRRRPSPALPNPTNLCSTFDSNSSATAPKTRRRQPKAEPGTKADVIEINDSTSATSDTENGGLPGLTCAVCMESVLQRRPTSTACGHIFCQECIFRAINQTKKCPLCNTKLKRQQVHRVYF